MMAPFRTSVPWSWLVLIVVAVGLPTAAAGTGTKARFVDSKSMDLVAEPEALFNVPETGPLRLTLAGAVIMAMENNRSLIVERLTPRIRETTIDEERAVFDPSAEGEIAVARNDQKNRSGGSLVESGEETGSAVLSLRQLFPTGTTVALEAGTEIIDSSLYRDPLTSTAMQLSVTQALQRGFDTEANTARLRQAELDVRISEYELKGFGEALMARVEATYWNLALARRQVSIVEESLHLAEQQLEETKQMIAVGTLAEAELPAVQAEVASQRQALITANGELDSLRLELLCLLNPPTRSCWDREVELIHSPELPEIELGSVAEHVAMALQMRPEIHQARLAIQRNTLDVVQTKNGLLPRLDLFVQLGKTGYADSFSGALTDMDGRHYTVQAGVVFEYPTVNRAAQARHRRARLEVHQAEKALANLVELVELDVRKAYIDVNRTRQQIAASTATRQFQEEKNRIETEKFRVGRSTSFLVAQAQRDLLSSRIAEVKAVVDYLKALTDLFRMDGSLLARRGLTVAPLTPTDPENENPAGQGSNSPP